MTRYSDVISGTRSLTGDRSGAATSGFRRCCRRHRDVLLRGELD